VEITGLGTVDAVGERDVFPKQTATYELVASKGENSARSTATVTVNPAIQATFTVAPEAVRYHKIGDKVEQQGSVTLSWSTSGADSVSIDNGVGTVAPVGDRTIMPMPTKSEGGPVDETVTYTLHATNACGVSETKSATVHIVGTIEAAAPPAFRIPPCTMQTPLPRQLIVNSSTDTLEDTFLRIVHALQNNKAKFRNYCVYPYQAHGYAVVATPERIEDNGMPLPGEKRWLLGDTPITGWTFKDIIERIFEVGDGRLRVIMLVVSDTTPTQEGAEVGEDILEAWSRDGKRYLPASLQSQIVQQETELYALIYEFHRKASGYPMDFVRPGEDPTDPFTHLAEAGLWKEEELERP
jgi:hypothetical protein